MERGFEGRGVVRGLVGGLGGRCGRRVVGQDKASTVSHGVPLGFRRRLGSFSHRARSVCTVRTPLAEAPRFEAFSESIRSLLKLLSFAAASTILIPHSALSRANRDSLSPLPTAPVLWEFTAWFASQARDPLVESCLPEAIASYGIKRRYTYSGDCPDGIEPVVKNRRRGN